MGNNTTGTPAAERCEAVVTDLFPMHVVAYGQYNRRPIAGTSTWSQHSWANGIDFMVEAVDKMATDTGRANGDEVHAFLQANREALGIRTLLWWVKDHFDHIHADFWAKGVGTPPLALTGVGTFRNQLGHDVQTVIQEAPMEGDYVFEGGNKLAYLPIQYGHGYKTPPEDSKIVGDQSYKQEDVRRLQRMINKGFNQNLDDDGVYGMDTVNVLKSLGFGEGKRIGGGPWYDQILAAYLTALIPVSVPDVDSIVDEIVDRLEE